MSDDGKIVRLVPRRPTEPPAEAIEMLEDIISRLKSGDVEAVAVVASGKNNEIHTAWFGWSAELVAPTQVLAARLMTDLRNNI